MPTGTTFSFTLNRSANVSFSFSRTVSGRKVHGRCVAQTKNNKAKPGCARTVGFGSFTVAAQTGAHKVRFAGRISPSKKLRPGTYTVTVTATGSSGRRSTPHTLSFTIVK